MTRWAMVIDLRKCIGCETCKHVCNDANHIPPGATWRRVVSFIKDKSLERASISEYELHALQRSSLS